MILFLRKTRELLLDPVLTYTVFALDISPAGYATNYRVRFSIDEELNGAKGIP